MWRGPENGCVSANTERLDAPATGVAGRLLDSIGMAGGALAGATIALFLAIHYVHPKPMPDSIATLLWYGVRGAGVAAYLVLWLTTVAGLCVARRIEFRWLPAGVVFFVHQLGDLALSLAGLHALLLLGDRFAGLTPGMLAVPFRASYRPLWTGLGIIALYLAAAVQWSVLLRPRLGYRAWRTIHYVSFLVFALALLHGLASGTDSALSPMRFTYILTGATVAAGIAWRPLRKIDGKTA